MVCPICGKETFLQQGSQRNPYFPFCSQRCRWVDLSNWLEGTYRIPAEEKSPLEDPDSNAEAEETE